MKNLCKKTLAVFSSALMSGLLLTSPFTASAADFRSGDATNDGTVDLYDAIAICKHILKAPALTGSNLKYADYNKDGNVDLYDSIGISRLILCDSKLNEVLNLINMKRSIENKPTLEFDYNIKDAAMKRASELPKKWSGSTRPDGSEFQTIFTEFGIDYEYCANSIAAVPATPKDLFTAMMDNSEVKSNVLDSKYTKVGIGYYKTNDIYKHYWAILLVG